MNIYTQKLEKNLKWKYFFIHKKCENVTLIGESVEEIYVLKINDDERNLFRATYLKNKSATYIF